MSRSEQRKVSFDWKCVIKIVWSIRSFCSEERSKKLLLTVRKSGEKGFGQRGPGLKRERSLLKIKSETKVVWSIRSFCSEERSESDFWRGRSWEKRVLVEKVQVWRENEWSLLKRKSETKIVWSIRSFCSEKRSKSDFWQGRSPEKRVSVEKVQVWTEKGLFWLKMCNQDSLVN